MTWNSEDEGRATAREREIRYRERRRRRAMLVPLEVEPAHLAALERLALLDEGERAPGAVAAAVLRFLAAAPAVTALGTALWPPQR